MHAYTSKCNYNEAPQEIDKKILEIELSKFKTYSDKRLVSKVKHNYVNDVQFKEKRVFSTQLIKQCGRKKRYYRITT